MHRNKRPHWARQTWHQLGDAASIRRILRVWHILMMRRHLAELPDDGNPYWSLQEGLTGGEDHRVKMLRQPGAAYDVVALDVSRLGELCESLDWLRSALKDDHFGKYAFVDGYKVLRDDVDRPCTYRHEACLAQKTIRAILNRAYERIGREDK